MSFRRDSIRTKKGSGPLMYKARLIIAVMVCSTAPAIAGQEIHLTIPRRSELTPVQRLNRNGVDNVVKHKYEKAEALFLKAYLFDPADPFTLNNLGYVSEIQGQVDRAADYYKLAMEQGCEAVIDRSSDKTLKGKPMMDALGMIKNMPMRVNRANTYAISLLSQGRGFEAEAVLEQALRLDPDNPFTLNNLAVAEEATGNLEDALTHYDAAASMHSKRPVIVSLKRSSRGKPISEFAALSAEELRRRTATMNIKEIRAQMFAVRGVSALNKNDLVTARKDFEQSFSEDPESAFALNNVGYLAERDGELETAMSFYARAQRAPDAADRVGMATQVTARGEHLASVANESHSKVGRVLKSRINIAPTSLEPLELLRRDDTSEPPASSSDQQTTPTVPLVPPAR